jgi:hypothetical protein
LISCQYYRNAFLARETTEEIWFLRSKRRIFGKGRACRTYRTRSMQVSGGETLENRGIDWRIILKWVFEKWDEVDGLYRSGSR